MRRWLPSFRVYGTATMFANDDDAEGWTLSIEWGHTIVEFIFARRDGRWR